VRVAGVVIAVVLGVVLAVGLSGARKAAPKPIPMPTVIVSNQGLEGLQEVWVQTHLAGDERWREVVGTDQDQLKSAVEERLSRIQGLRVLQGTDPDKARVMVQIVGHVVMGFDEGDPPAATHITLAVSQPVALRRKGAAGQPVLTSGITGTTGLLLSGKASTMRERVKGKVAYLLDGFERDYRRANP
jgi:hypothetical protein